MIMKRIIIFFCAALLLSGLDGCTGDGKKTHVKSVPDSDAQASAADVTNVVYTKYGIPLPIDLFKYLVAEDIPYNIDLLVPIENMDKYTKETKQAMALGVYSADIAYCSLYKRQQDVMGYFNCSFKLADKLDISEGFNFAGESYWKAWNYLNDNEKNNILPLIVYGGWVESQYLTVASNDLKNTREQIMNQREGLLSLINYLYEVMIESTAFYYNYDIKHIIMDLNNIKKLYDKVSDNSIDAQTYSKISDCIKTMRTELIDPNKN